MKTYSQNISQLQSISQNSTDTALVNFKIWYNQSLRVIASIRNGRWKWLETTKDVLTVADQRTYQIPNKFRKLVDLYVTVGTDPNSTIYMPRPIFDPGKWKAVLAARLGTSEVPYFYYVENDKVQIAPIPANTGDVITMRGRLDLADDLIDDYTTGSIVSIANGTTTVTGTGTTWTTSMAGRYIQITESDSANKGDGFWYEIASVTSATVLELTKKYEGTSIAAGTAAYTIGQVSPIPEAYQDAPLFRTLALYWGQHGDATRSKMYWGMYDGGKEAGFSNTYGGLICEMLEESGETVEGAYISPNDNILDINTSYYYPYGDASGFS